MKRVLYILLFISFFSFDLLASTNEKDSDLTAKHVRKFINEGNKCYREGDYGAAETYYRDALQEDSKSNLAMFNLGLALLKQQTANKAQSDTLRTMSKNNFLNVVGSSSADPLLVEKSFYNLGNIAFSEENYANSIEMYKEVLRINPNNIAARQNLRVAQIKLKDQQNNQGGQDKNQQQEQQQNEQQQQKGNEQQQQQQNQNQQQEEQDKKDEQQNSAAQNNKNEQPKDKSEGAGVTGRPQISEENAEKILQAAAKQEEQTRKKVEQHQQQNTSRRIIGNPW